MAWTTYPQPNITNYTGIFDYANEVTTNVFGASIPWLVFIVAYTIFSTGGYPPLKSIMGASYLAWVIAIMMSVLGWVETYMVVIFAIMVAASTAISFWKRREPWE